MSGGVCVDIVRPSGEMGGGEIVAVVVRVVLVNCRDLRSGYLLCPLIVNEVRFERLVQLNVV